MKIVDDNLVWMYEPSTTGTNKDVETIITGDTDSDYVKVVRCENCKYWVTTPGELIAPYCEKIGIKDDNGYRDFDDFCSRGERKETNDKR